MDKKKTANCYISGVLLILFLVISILVITNNISWFDDSIYNFIFSFRNNELDIILKTLTRLGDTLTITIIVIILLLILKRKDRVILASTTILTVGINQIIKHILKRPRPDHLRLIKQGGYSYPSGHSMIAICVYGLMIYFINKKIKNKTIKIALSSVLTLLILIIGISRIYVGVHYPSDVLGGYLLSLAILILNVTFSDKIYRGIIYEKNDNK